MLLIPGTIRVSGRHLQVKMPVAVHWFRKGLRLHDNPALLSALKYSSGATVPLFVIDPWFLTESGRVGARRYQFLLESLRDLEAQLRDDYGARLLVARGQPQDVVPRVCMAAGATLLTFEADTEPYAQARDGNVRELVESAGVRVEAPWSHTLHDMTHLAHLAGDNGPPTVYSSFLKKIFERAGPVPKPVPVPDTSAFAPLEVDLPMLLPDLHMDLGVPEMKDGETPCPFLGGERAGLERMRAHLGRQAWVRTFEKPKTKPNSLEPSTTVLSPYLKFGCVSVRTFWHELKKIEGQVSKPPTSLLGQLLWREFYYTSAFCCPNYDQMEGNPICRQIDWIEPVVGGPEDTAGIASSSSSSSATAAAHLKAWQEGKTGYPWIDAIMTQLKEQGWIHHLARHSVACFLTRGDLFISWEHGARHFDKMLLDADWALNNGNWMWLSASCYFHQFFRVYSPVAFGKKTDKNGDYIRKWLPKLRKMPAKYIYEPWTAPRSVQEQAGCVVGVDYPHPIVDHNVVSKRNMLWMKEAYERHRLKSSSGVKNKLTSNAGQKRKKNSSAERKQTTLTLLVNKKRAKAQ